MQKHEDLFFYLGDEKIYELKKELYFKYYSDKADYKVSELYRSFDGIDGETKWVVTNIEGYQYSKASFGRMDYRIEYSSKKYPHVYIRVNFQEALMVSDENFSSQRRYFIHSLKMAKALSKIAESAGIKKSNLETNERKMADNIINIDFEKDGTVHIGIVLYIKGKRGIYYIKMFGSFVNFNATGQLTFTIGGGFDDEIFAENISIDNIENKIRSFIPELSKGKTDFQKLIEAENRYEARMEIKVNRR